MSDQGLHPSGLVAEILHPQKGPQRHIAGGQFEEFNNLQCQQGARRKEDTVWSPTSLNFLRGTSADPAESHPVFKSPSVHLQLSFQNTFLNWCSCTGNSTLLPNHWHLWLPVLPVQAVEFPLLHKPSLPHTPLPLASPCSWLNPFISATCSTFPSDCTSLFFFSHFLIKIYFHPSILWPCLSYFWVWWGFTHWQQSQNQMWALVLLKDIAQMENLAAFVSK